MEALLLSRWQFAITTVYHFLFVPITLGLSIFTALLETCYVRTQHPEWKPVCKKLTKFFGTIFLINFAMGVVTGWVLAFQICSWLTMTSYTNSSYPLTLTEAVRELSMVFGPS